MRRTKGQKAHKPSKGLKKRRRDRRRRQKAFIERYGSASGRKVEAEVAPT